MNALRVLCTIALLSMSTGGMLQAQIMDTLPTPKRNQFVRFAKWTTLAASAGAAVYGFTTNRRADDGYAELEELCEANRANCEARNAGAYADPALEQRYQDVIALDGKARNALVASQVGVAATVLLFIYDLRSAAPPRGIPYEPRSLEVAPAKDGGLQLRMTLPVGRPGG